MKQQRGVALLEFAMILPLLLVLTAMTTELGRAIHHYGMLAKSVREAARFLSVRAPNTGVAEARNIILYGNPQGRGTVKLPGLTVSNVPTPTWVMSGSYPAVRLVTVTVQGYRFVPMLARVFGRSFNTLTFSPISATMRSPA